MVAAAAAAAAVAVPTPTSTLRRMPENSNSGPLHWGYVGVMENQMETTIILGLYSFTQFFSTVRAGKFCWSSGFVAMGMLAGAWSPGTATENKNPTER